MSEFIFVKNGRASIGSVAALPTKPLVGSIPYPTCILNVVKEDGLKS
jgi:hypothetical protein